MEFKKNTFIVAFQVNRCMFEYGLSKLPQGSMQDVLWAYEEVILVKDIIIDIRQIADAEFSGIYKMTVEMENTAQTVTAISIQRHCGRLTMTNNVEANTPEIYWRRFVYQPFLDHLLQEFDTKFSALTRKAMLGLKFLPNNVGKLTYANITDHPQLPCQLKSDCGRKYGISQKKQSYIIYTKQRPAPCSQIFFCIFTIDNNSRKYPKSNVFH